MTTRHAYAHCTYHMHGCNTRSIVNVVHYRRRLAGDGPESIPASCAKRPSRPLYKGYQKMKTLAICMLILAIGIVYVFSAPSSLFTDNPHVFSHAATAVAINQYATKTALQAHRRK